MIKKSFKKKTSNLTTIITLVILGVVVLGIIAGGKIVEIGTRFLSKASERQSGILLPTIPPPSPTPLPCPPSLVYPLDNIQVYEKPVLQWHACGTPPGNYQVNIISPGGGQYLSGKTSNTYLATNWYNYQYGSTYQWRVRKCYTWSGNVICRTSGPWSSTQSFTYLGQPITATPIPLSPTPTAALGACTNTLNWGSEGGGNGQFLNPSGIGVKTAEGFIYVADTSNNRIQKFTSGGTWQENLTHSFNQPTDVTVDSQGALYIADSTNHRIVKYAGGQWNEWDTGTNSRPYGVAIFESGGNIYAWVTENAFHVVKKYNAQTGALLQTISTGGLAYPRGIAVDAAGNIYVAHMGGYGGQFNKYDASGSLVFTRGFPEAWGIAVGPNGNIWVAGEIGDSSLMKRYAADGITVLNSWGDFHGARGIRIYAPSGNPNYYAYVADADLRSPPYQYHDDRVRQYTCTP